MRVSLVVRAYNEERHLEKLLLGISATDRRLLVWLSRKGRWGWRLGGS
jgi:hypothetical protein